MFWASWVVVQCQCSTPHEPLATASRDIGSNIDGCCHSLTPKFSNFFNRSHDILFLPKQAQDHDQQELIGWFIITTWQRRGVRDTLVERMICVDLCCFGRCVCWFIPTLVPSFIWTILHEIASILPRNSPNRSAWYEFLKEITRN